MHSDVCVTTSDTDTDLFPSYPFCPNLHPTYTVYDAGTTSSGSSSEQSFTSLTPSEQEGLDVALRNLNAEHPETLLALCAALDVDGKRAEVAGRVHAMAVHAYKAINKVLCPRRLEPILGGVAWGLGRDLRSAMCQALLALYSSPDLVNSGAVALSTKGEFALLWRQPTKVLLESSRYWADWFFGRQTSFIDLLENDDFWDSGQFRTHTAGAGAPEGRLETTADDVNRLLAFVDAVQCPFVMEEASMAEGRGKKEPSKAKGWKGWEEWRAAEEQEAELWRRRTHGARTGRPRGGETTHVASDHIDKAMVRRVHAVFPAAEGDYAAYVAANMPDPRVVAAAFACLPVELRHWV